MNFTNAKSGSIPVVSQSITKPIVPVGAITVVCAFLKPYFFPKTQASSQADLANSTTSLFGQLSTSRGIGFTASPLYPSLLLFAAFL